MKVPNELCALRVHILDAVQISRGGLLRLRYFFISSVRAAVCGCPTKVRILVIAVKVRAERRQAKYKEKFCENFCDPGP